MSAFHPSFLARRALRFYVTGVSEGESLIQTVQALPPGIGVVYRNYESPDRWPVASRLLDVAAARPVLIAGHGPEVARFGAPGLHLPSWALAKARRCDLVPFRFVSAAVHTSAEWRKARLLGVDAVFLSPVFSTASHPDTRPLGPHRLARFLDRPGPGVLALGGMNRKAMRKLPQHPRLLGYGAKTEFEQQA